MSDQVISRVSAAPGRRIAAGAALTLAIALAGLFIVKWSPYYAKATAAAVHHSIGRPIFDAARTAHQPVWERAVSYAYSYFGSIWEALVLALLLGACIQVLIPQRNVFKHLGSLGVRSTAIAAVACMAGMMCTCCTAPVIVGLRNQRASAGISMAAFIGTPTLNPAVLLFICFTLSWPLAALRFTVGLLLVIVAAFIAERLSSKDQRLTDLQALSAIEDAEVAHTQLFVRWLRVVWWEIYTIVPGYVAIVLALGALQPWLFQPHALQGSNGVLAAIAAAIAGTLFVIPTAAEVPLIQNFLHGGMGIAPAAALLIALPAISVPSMYIARGAFPLRVFAAVACAVALSAAAAAGIAVAAGIHPFPA